MEESNVRIKQKGIRKTAKKPDPEPEPEPTEKPESESEAEVEVEVKPKTKPKAKAKVEKEEYDVEQQPDVIIHKRHKGSKPRKIIVITGDSSADESDEEMPYRAKPKVEIKRRAPKVEPEPEPKPKIIPPKPKIVPVQKVSQKPNADIGAGLPERYAHQAVAKKGYVVDEWIDKLMGF
jgi:hypothetical protein